MANPFGGASSGQPFGQPPATSPFGQQQQQQPLLPFGSFSFGTGQGTPASAQNVFGTQQQPVQNLFLQQPKAPLFSFGNTLQTTGSSFATPTQPSTPFRFNTPLVTTGTGAAGTNQAKPTFTFPSFNPNLFGNSPVAATPGTPVRFQVIEGSETLNKGGVSQQIRTRTQYITAMKEYENKSFEELRCEDYLANRKGPQQSVFGIGQVSVAPTTTASIFPSFNNTASIASAPSSTPIFPTFNLTTNTAPTTTPSLFSNPNATPATGSLFNNTYKPPFTWPTSTTTPAKPLFSSPLAPSTTTATGTSFGFNTAPTTTTPAPATTFPTFSFPNNNNNNQMQTGNSNPQLIAFPVAPAALQSPFQPQTLNAAPQVTQPSTLFSSTPFTFPSTPATTTTASSQITAPQQGVNNNMWQMPPQNVTLSIQQPGIVNLQGSSSQYPVAQLNGVSTPVALIGVPLTHLAASHQHTSPRPPPFALSHYRDSPLFYNLLPEEKPAAPRRSPRFSNGPTQATHTTFGSSASSLIYPNPENAKRTALLLQTRKLFEGFDEEEEVRLRGVDILAPKKISRKKLDAASLRILIPFMDPAEVEQLAAKETSDYAKLLTPEKEGNAENNSGDNKSHQIGMSFGIGASQESADTETAAEPEPEVSPVCKRRCGVICTRSGYYTVPSIEELDTMVDHNGNCIVSGFQVGRKNYGRITFPLHVNVAGLNIDEILLFRHKELVIYPDESKKPAIGDGLNCPADVELENVWPVDKCTNEFIKSPEMIQNMKYELKLRRVSEALNVDFLYYCDKSGVWKFRVKHF